jgi:hypothetical protein
MLEAYDIADSGREAESSFKNVFPHLRVDN